MLGAPTSTSQTLCVRPPLPTLHCHPARVRGGAEAIGARGGHVEVGAVVAELLERGETQGGSGG